MHRAIDICVKYAKQCLILFLLVTIFFAWKAADVKIDSNLRNVLPKGESSDVVLDDMDSYLFLGFKAKEGGELFTIESLKVLSSVISEIERLPEVKKTISVFNTDTLQLGSNGRLLSGTILPEGKIPETEAELSAFKEHLFNDPFFRNIIVSGDGKYITTVFLTSQESEDNKLFNSRLKSITAPLREYVDINMAGDLILINRAEFYLTRDFSTLLVAALIVMLVILFISFRARRALILPVMVVIMGVIWTIGFISLIGFKLSVVTCVVPALVLTIGSSYTIHVLNEFFRNAPSCSNGDKAWICEAVVHVNKTIMMASLTTIIGFLSLLGGSQKVIKEFALSVSFGVAATAVLSLFLLPAIFSMLKDPKQLHLRVANHGYLTSNIGKVGSFIIRFRYSLVVIGVLIGLSTFYFIPKLTVGSNYYSYFPKGDKVLKDIMHVTEMNGGTTWINLTLEAPEGSKGYFGTYEGLKLQSELEDRIKQSPYVWDVVSMSSYLRKMNQVRFGEYTIPERNGLIVLLKRTFERVFSSNDGIFKEVHFVEDNYNRVTMLVRLYNREKNEPINENDFPAFTQFLEKTLNETLDSGITTRLWGMGYLTNMVSHLLLGDQLKTLIISFFLVFLVSCIYFKSIYYGFVTIIPLITAICTNYIFMVILNIPLDVTTIMVSSVAIGVGVDDAIHFLIQYRKQLNINPENIHQVISETYIITGRPIVLTTISIASGMLVLILASFLPIGYFGILVSLALFGALAGTLIFLPAVLVVSYEILKKLNLLSLARS